MKTDVTRNTLALTSLQPWAAGAATLRSAASRQPAIDDAFVGNLMRLASESARQPEGTRSVLRGTYAGKKVKVEASKISARDAAARGAAGIVNVTGSVGGTHVRLAMNVAQGLAVADLSGSRLSSGLSIKTADVAQVSHDSSHEKSVLAKMQANLPNMFDELMEKATAEMASGKEDFSFAMMGPVLERLKATLLRLKTQQAGGKHAGQIDEVVGKMNDLLTPTSPDEQRPPYMATVRFIFNDFLPVCDKIFGEKHPELMGNDFHRHHAEHLLEQFLEHEPGKPPKLLLFFSQEPVDMEFFLKARTAPMYLVGLNLVGLDDDDKRVPSADAFNMKPSEFSWHDMGHIDFMWGRDQLYFKNTSKTPLRVTKEWEATRGDYMKFYDPWKKKDPDLHEAMTHLLFEIVHERGFQYSLTVMKKELETPKWTEILQRKLGNGYYDSWGSLNRRPFARLEEARHLLLDYTRQLRMEAQTQWFNTLKADQVPATFVYNAPLRYGVGRLQSVDMTGVEPKDLKVNMRNGETRKIDTTDTIHMLLPQVNPAQSHPFDDMTRLKIGWIMTAMRTGEQVLAGSHFCQAEKVQLTPDKRLWVVLTDGSRHPLESVEVRPGTPSTPIDNLRYFEMIQMLGSEERNGQLCYTVEQPSVVLSGTASLYQSEKSGETRLHVRDHRTGRIKGDFTLADTRIDTLDLKEQGH